MNNFIVKKIFDNIVKNIRMIVILGAIGMVIGTLYATLIYKPLYISTVKILVGDEHQVPYVIDLNTQNPLMRSSIGNNLIYTQMQVLKSAELSKKVWKNIKQKYKFETNDTKGEKFIQESVTIVNPTKTNIIEITAKWTKPEVAQDVASEYAKVYKKLNENRLKRQVLNNKIAISIQLDNAQDNLLKIRQSIKKFRESSLSVDLKAEAETMVTQLRDLENKYFEIISVAGGEASRINSITKRLGLSSDNAINSIALGHNANIIALQSKLERVEEELADLLSKYTELHPSVVSLRARADKIKLQINRQVKQTIGIGNSQPNIYISDPIRTNMIQSLALSESSYKSLKAQSESLKKTIKSLKNKQKRMPGKQLILANLMQEKNNWINIVDKLKNKFIEAKIRESKIISNISVIEYPQKAEHPVFPSRFQLILIFVLLGLMIGLVSSVIEYLIKNIYESPEELEHDLKIAHLGSIPWISPERYSEDNGLIISDDFVSVHSLSYQKIVSALNLKSFDNDRKIVSFTSTEPSKLRSGILVNIAYSLRKTGQSVILIDADFRTPTIHKEFGFMNSKFSLSALINKIAESKRTNANFDWRDLEYYIKRTDEVYDISILSNYDNIMNPNEYIHSREFKLLINKLSEMYDWVLLDLPPVSAVMDAVATGANSNGIVLISGINTTKNTLRKTVKQFNTYKVPILGVITREPDFKEVKISNEYLKQIISNVMPSSSNIVKQ